MLPTIAALLAALGCTGATTPAARTPGLEPDLVGTVREVGALGRPGTVRVVDLTIPRTGYDSGILLQVGSAPVYVRQPDGRLVAGSRSDLRPGAVIHAWSTGVELRSLPPQWSAVRVEVTPR